MTLKRWNLYNVFIVIPVGLLKALALKTAVLDDVGDGDMPPVVTQQQVGERSGGWCLHVNRHLMWWCAESKSVPDL
jgi:hypothetical protein